MLRTKAVDVFYMANKISDLKSMIPQQQVPLKIDLLKNKQNSATDTRKRRKFHLLIGCISLLKVMG